MRDVCGIVIRNNVRAKLMTGEYAQHALAIKTVELLNHQKTCLQGKCVDHRKIQTCESGNYEDWDFNAGVSLQIQQQCLNKWRTTELENERAKVCSDACRSVGSRPPMCTGSMDDCFKFSRFSSECNAKNGVQGTYHWGCNGT